MPLQSAIRILICDPIDQEGINKLIEAGFTIDVKPAIEHDELKKIVPNYDVLIVRNRTKVTKEVIDAGTRIKNIGRAGAGLDNIDVEAAERKGIRILNTLEAPAEAVAELTIGLMLSLARNIPRSDHAMKERRWTKKENVGWELHGKTLGTIGLGHIGERVARLAKAFGMKILINKRNPPDSALLKELQAEFLSLRDMLPRCDILTIHIPYTDKSHHLIGENELSLMKNGTFLINTSRGAIIEEKSLLKALQLGKLGGAALDVYEVEPPIDWTLMQLPNVICTPHIGAQTQEAQKTASVLLAEKIISVLT
jgi:D-3-phosphoglycerate dehydrogenase